MQTHIYSNNLDLINLTKSELINLIRKQNNEISALNSYLSINAKLEQQSEITTESECRYGSKCKFLNTIGKCNEYHSPNEICRIQSKIPCKFGNTCRYNTTGNCNYFHEKK
jgi:hypothetical protein